MSKLNWGLIGCGDIARKRVAPALRDLPNCELIAVNRARADRAEAFAREFGAGSWYGDWRELLADERVEAVYIATPVHLHAAQTIAAAEAGKHVLCEKPMALSVAECDRMVAACDAHGVRLGVAYYRHFYPVVERIKAIISSGEIGRPVVAQMNAFEWFDPEPSHPRRWLLDKAQSGGGPMFDFGCHRIELLVSLFGPVKSVNSLVGNVLFDREVEDTACALFAFQGRPHAALTVTHAARQFDLDGGPHAALTVTHAARQPRDTLDIYGSEGSLHVAVLNEGNLKVVTRDGERVETHPPHPNLHQPLIDDFTRAVLDDRAPVVDGGVGREVARLVEEVYKKRALDTGKPVDRL